MVIRVFILSCLVIGLVMKWLVVVMIISWLLVVWCLVSSVLFLVSMIGLIIFCMNWWC